MKRFIQICVLLFIISCKPHLVFAIDTNEHFYSFKDGSSYGYEGRTDGEQPIAVIQFVGGNKDRFQVFDQKGKYLVVQEFYDICDFYKLMTFEPGIKKAQLKQYGKVNYGTIMHAICLDATLGKLTKRWTVKRNGKRYYVWFDEEEGMILSPVNE